MRTLADGLFGRPAVHPFGAAIPIDDCFIQIGGPDGFIGRIQEFRLGPNFFVGAPLLGDIANGRGNEQSFIGLDRTEADLDWELVAIFVQAVQIQARAHGPQPGGRQKSRSGASSEGRGSV